MEVQENLAEVTRAIKHWVPCVPISAPASPVKVPPPSLVVKVVPSTFASLDLTSSYNEAKFQVDSTHLTTFNGEGCISCTAAKEFQFTP
jgi:hypothetical protein